LRKGICLRCYAYRKMIAVQMVFVRFFFGGEVGNRGKEQILGGTCPQLRSPRVYVPVTICISHSHMYVPKLWLVWTVYRKHKPICCHYSPIGQPQRVGLHLVPRFLFKFAVTALSLSLRCLPKVSALTAVRQVIPDLVLHP